MYCPRLEDSYLQMARDMNSGKYDLNTKGLSVKFNGNLEETEEAAKAWAKRVMINMERYNKKENKKWYQFWK
jgi:hypothetical protein